ncbi:MAG: hypothetical protein HUJ64_09125 [Limosilactobacillus mucosae]|nr:hypothetical protein [Limosilactobacillus mucosae]
MVSSYKGTENKEQTKRLLLTVSTAQGIMTINITGVFRTETALIDQARRKGTLYRTTDALGNMIAIAPEQIVSIKEAVIATTPPF